MVVKITSSQNGGPPEATKGGQLTISLAVGRGPWTDQKREVSVGEVWVQLGE